MTTTGSTALVLRITELKAENAALKEQYSKAEDANYNLQGKLLVAQQRIKELREAISEMRYAPYREQDVLTLTPDNTAEYDALVKQRDELLDLLSRYGVYAPSEVQDEINKALDAAMKADK